jgi:hypothetical protein
MLVPSLDESVNDAADQALAASVLSHVVANRLLVCLVQAPVVQGVFGLSDS